MNITILVLCICLAALFFYFYFVKKIDYLGRFSSGFIIMLLLSFVMVFAVYKGMNAINEVSQFVTPYSGNISASYTPAIPGGDSQIWQFETPDSFEQVEVFYSKEENRKGWVVIQPLPFMTLKKGDKIMRISVISMRKTSITYSLSKDNNQDI